MTDDAEKRTEKWYESRTMVWLLAAYASNVRKIAKGGLSPRRYGAACVVCDRCWWAIFTLGLAGKVHRSVCHKS